MYLHVLSRYLGRHIASRFVLYPPPPSLLSLAPLLGFGFQEVSDAAAAIGKVSRCGGSAGRVYGGRAARVRAAKIHRAG